ncbi:hypothetical protein [Helicobacter sp. 11S03491-1]|uniref:hypothetical protein n=1 Tax=Helicobacter sp. 11S03491-1 TaxID=1476196 RepID=UPI00117B2A50|nr:hypothetical protein [Helicobacter sp. 11S03491-1]
MNFYALGKELKDFPSETLYPIDWQGMLFGGLEFNDGDFNGAQVYFSSDFNGLWRRDFLVGINYVFEPQESDLTYALITGFDLGMQFIESRNTLWGGG